MKNYCKAAIGLLALLAVAACAPLPEPAQLTVTAAVALPTAATLNAEASTPTAAPATPTPTPPPSINVASSAEVIPSSGQESAHLAVDGDLDSLWNSGRVPLGWFRVALDGLYLVNRVELIIAQTPPGPTMHELWLGDGSGTRSLYERLVNEKTEDGQTLAVTIEPPRSINEVMVRTVSSPSWVAWREVRVFGVPADSAPPPPLTLTEIVSGLNLPVQLAHAGDGSGRLFVVEQAGSIRIIRNTGLPDAAPAWSVLETPFLDITTRVSCCGERGLLDVAFPPGYDANSTSMWVIPTTTATQSSAVSKPQPTHTLPIRPARRFSSPSSNRTIRTMAGASFLDRKMGICTLAAATAEVLRSTILTTEGRISVHSWAKYSASTSSRVSRHTPFPTPTLSRTLKAPMRRSGPMACAIHGDSHSTSKQAISISPT